MRSACNTEAPIQADTEYQGLLYAALESEISRAGTNLNLTIPASTLSRGNTACKRCAKLVCMPERAIALLL